MAIDMMNYAPLIAPGLSGPEYACREFQIMVETTFRSMVVDDTIQTLWGRAVPISGDIEIEELMPRGLKNPRLLSDMRRRLGAVALRSGGSRAVGVLTSRRSACAAW